MKIQEIIRSNIKLRSVKNWKTIAQHIFWENGTVPKCRQVLPFGMHWITITKRYLIFLILSESWIIRIFVSILRNYHSSFHFHNTCCLLGWVIRVRTWKKSVENYILFTLSLCCDQRFVIRYKITAIFLQVVLNYLAISYLCFLLIHKRTLQDVTDQR